MLISGSRLMFEYSLAIMSFLVIGVGICSFSASIKIVGMTRLIQQGVVAELPFLATLRRLVNRKHSLVHLTNRQVKFIPLLLKLSSQRVSLVALGLQIIYGSRIFATFTSRKFILFLFDKFLLPFRTQIEHGDRLHHQIVLDFFIQRTICGKRRKTVNFDEPWLNLVVQENIET